MTVTGEIKILDDNSWFKVNQGQNNLDRGTGKISPSSSKELDKYKYMTGEDSEYEQGVFKQDDFEYPPSSTVFNKGLKEKLLKRLKNVEDINKKQLEKQLKPIKYEIERANWNAFKKLRFLNKLGTIANELINEVREIDQQIDYIKLISVYTNGKIYNFNIFRGLFY